MLLIEELLKQFNRPKELKITETAARFNMTFKISFLPNLKQWGYIEKIIEEYPRRDIFNMTVRLTEDDYFYIFLKNSSAMCDGPEHIIGSEKKKIENAIKKLDDLKNKDDEINIEVNIEKKCNNGIISVYSVNTFMTWILDMKINKIIDLFSNLYNSNNNLIFISYDKDIKIVTETFQFSREENWLGTSHIKRKEILESSLEVANIQNSNINVIPNDFNIKECLYYDDNKILTKINNIRDILSLMYIADISSFRDDICEFRINGYRNSNYQIEYRVFQNNQSNKCLYNIYKWIYGDGNIVDKSIIARNVISLHCRYNNILALDDENFNSIKTNYSYYLKKNTDEYLEEKKELYLSITEKCSLLSEALYNFIGDMKKNFIGYFTYLATLILSNTIMNGEFKEIFTVEVTFITSIIILGSIIYLGTSLTEANNKLKTVLNYIEDLKEGYGYILGKSEVENIIKNNESYSNAEKRFKRGRVIVSIIWIVFTICLFLALDYISGNNKLLFFINIFKDTQ